MTNSKQTIQLFPKVDYLMDNKTELYMYSDLGNGDYGDKDFELEFDESNSIFITNKLNQDPFDLALQVFDSIYIIPLNKNKTIMKFYPDSVIGYTENLFDSNSKWNFEKNNYDEHDNFNQNPVESNEYTFIISTDKY